LGKRREQYDVLRVKFAYQRAVNKALGKKSDSVVKISVSTDTKRGLVNYNFCKRISQRLREAEVPVEEYMSVMFNRSLGGQVRGKKWPYPYLSYLSGERAFEVFKYRKEKLKRLYLREDAAKVMVETKKVRNYDDKFVNCFYNGFSVLERVVANGKLSLYQSSPIRLFVVFLAFNEVFTPEFIYTHKRFHEIEALHPMSYKERETKAALILATEFVWKRGRGDALYLRDLKRSRRNVRREELMIVKQVHGYKKDWRKIWQLLG